jgi:hypothetical protein
MPTLARLLSIAFSILVYASLSAPSFAKGAQDDACALCDITAQDYFERTPWAVTDFTATPDFHFGTVTFEFEVETTFGEGECDDRVPDPKFPNQVLCDVPRLKCAPYIDLDIVLDDTSPFNCEVEWTLALGGVLCGLDVAENVVTVWGDTTVQVFNADFVELICGTSCKFDFKFQLTAFAHCTLTADHTVSYNRESVARVTLICDKCPDDAAIPE